MFLAETYARVIRRSSIYPLCSSSVVLFWFVLTPGAESARLCVVLRQEKKQRDAEEKEDAAVIVSPPLPDYPLPIMQSWRYDVAGKGLEAVLEGGAALQLNGATFVIERRSS